MKSFKGFKKGDLIITKGVIDYKNNSIHRYKGIILEKINDTIGEYCKVYWVSGTLSITKPHIGYHFDPSVISLLAKRKEPKNG